MSQRLHIIGGALGCLGGIALAFIGYLGGESGTLEIGATVLVASIVYLLFRNRIANSPSAILPANQSLVLILNIVFFSALAASIYLMHSSVYRPPLYFLLTSISVAAVAAEILSYSDKTRTWLPLLKILLISFSLRYGLLYESPGFYGVDPWWHSIFIEEWLREGHIVPIVSIGRVGYADFPMMHLNVMATRLITLADPKNSLFLSIGVYYIFSTLFVFLLGERLLGTKAGLLAALVLSFNRFHISWGAWLIPTSLGVAIFTMILWLVFKGSSRVSETLILIVLFSFLVLTHTLSSFVIAIALFLLFIGNEAYRRWYKTGRERMNIGIPLVCLFWVIMFARWIYSSYFSSQPFFDSVAGYFVRTLQVDVQYTGAAFEASATSFGPLNRVSFLTFIGFIVIGSLFWLSPKAINNKKLAIIMGSAGLAGVTFLFPVFHIRNLMTDRWPSFISVLGATIAVEGILALSSILRGSVKKSLLIVLITFVFSLLMVNGHDVNTHTPFYGRDYRDNPVRYAFTKSELSAVETLTKVYPGKITTDSPYGSLAFTVQAGRARIKYLSGDSESEGLIAVREYLHSRPSIVGYSAEQYDEFLSNLEGSRYNKIYDNDEVKGYVAGNK